MTGAAILFLNRLTSYIPSTIPHKYIFASPLPLPEITFLQFSNNIKTLVGRNDYLTGKTHVDST